MSISPEYFSNETPAEIALPLAEALVMKKYFDDFDQSSDFEQTEIVALEAKADIAGLLGRQYFVSSHRSLSIPVSFDAESPTTSFDFNEGLEFSGTLVTYSTVRIGRSLGGNAVRALCLTFNDVTLLPYFDHLPDDHLLYTPAFAVRDIDALPQAS